jgi:hypothetical protein
VVSTAFSYKKFLNSILGHNQTLLEGHFSEGTFERKAFFSGDFREEDFRSFSIGIPAERNPGVPSEVTGTEKYSENLWKKPHNKPKPHRPN